MESEIPSGAPQPRKGAKPNKETHTLNGHGAKPKNWREQYNAEIAEGWRVDASGKLIKPDDPAEWDRLQKRKAHSAAPPPRIPWPAPYAGPMADLVDACQRSAKRKQPELATMGVLVAMAACISSVYQLEGDGLRCNLYGTGSAMSARGKDIIKRMAQLMAAHAKALNLGAPGSGPGFQDALVSYQPMLSVIDEAHGYFAASNDRRGSPHVAQTLPVMLDLYTASSGMYVPRLLASERSKRNKGQTQPPVAHPMFNLLAFSTPERLRGALTVENIMEGLMGRMLVAIGADNSEDLMDFATSALVLPDSVQAVIKDLGLVLQRGTAAMEGEPVAFVNVKLDKGALERLKQMDSDDAQARKRMAEGSLERTLNMRAVERVTRIAMVPAIWANPAAPVITLEMLDWAHRVALASDSHMLALIGIEGSALGGDDQDSRDAARVLRAIRSYISRTGEERCPRPALQQNTGLHKKRLDAALEFLVDTQQIEAEEQSSAGAVRNYNAKFYRVV